METDEVPRPTRKELYKVVVEEWGPWATEFISTMNHFQRSMISPGDVQYGYLWDYRDYLGDTAWKYPLSLLNVYAQFFY